MHQKSSFWGSNQIFKKGGLGRTSTFRGGLLGKIGWLFLGEEGCNFHIKNRLKSVICNDKKKFTISKNFSVITKNSNGEILTMNLVTFKRQDGMKKDEKLWLFGNPLKTLTFRGVFTENQYRGGIA